MVIQFSAVSVQIPQVLQVMTSFTSFNSRSFASFAFGHLSFRASSDESLLSSFGAGFLTLFGMTEVFSHQPQHLNTSTPEGRTRAECPIYFSPIPQGWGIDAHTLV